MQKATLIYVSASIYANQNPLSWHPVQAVCEHGNCYRIIELNPDPEHYYMQFSFGDVARCEENKFAEGEFGLIAVEKCAHK